VFVHQKPDRCPIVLCPRECIARVRHPSEADDQKQTNANALNAQTPLIHDSSSLQLSVVSSQSVALNAYEALTKLLG
jgi:hypothetical protein